MFTPGTNEIVVGRAASRQFSNLDGRIDGAVGQDDLAGRRHLRRGRQRRRVRAVVRRQGAAGRLPARQLAISRSTCGCETIDSLQRAEGRADHRPAAERHRRSASRTTTRSSRRCCRRSSATIGFGIAVLMGLGAVFGAVNTMYSAVAARTREIATLRALGFGSTPVVVSVLIEARAPEPDRRRARRRWSPGPPSTATRPRP